MRAMFGAGLILLLAGCGGGDGKGGDPASARVNVLLVDAPSPEYAKLMLDVQRVEIAQAGAGWIVLAEPRRTVDLLSLSGGVMATLAQGAALPPGRYTQLRLVLGPGNTVTLPDQSVQPLEVPSGQQSGLKVPIAFDVVAGATKDLVIDFDGARSVHVRTTGASSRYLLRPVVNAQDKESTGSVTGSLKTAGGAAIPGALVIAQTLDAQGNPVIQRIVQTGSDGAFVLDLLPAGATYYVATQPVVGTTGYASAAAGPFAVSGSSFTFTTALTSAPLNPSGTVTGVVQPALGPDQGDLVMLQGSFSLGGATRTLVTRTVPAKFTDSYELFTFPASDLGLQSVRALRTTYGPDGGSTTTLSLNAPAVNPQSASPVAAVIQF